MIVKVDFPVWGRCIYNLEPQPTDVQAFHMDACAWVLWRNALRHAYMDHRGQWNVDPGNQMIGYRSDTDCDGFQWADVVLFKTACI